MDSFKNTVGVENKKNGKNNLWLTNLNSLSFRIKFYSHGHESKSLTVHQENLQSLSWGMEEGIEQLIMLFQYSILPTTWPPSPFKNTTAWPQIQICYQEQGLMVEDLIKC